MKKIYSFLIIIYVYSSSFICADYFSPKIAVLDFRNTIADKEWNIMEWLIPEYLTNCFRKNKNLTVINRRNIENIVSGSELDYEKVTDQETGFKVGAILQADVIVMGSYKRVDGCAVIAVFLLDIKERVPICGLYIIENKGENMESMVSRLYNQINRIAFPAQEEKVKKENNKKVNEEKNGTIKIGLRTGVFPGGQIDNIKGGEAYLNLIDKNGFGIQINLGGYKRKINEKDYDFYLLPLFFTYQHNITPRLVPYIGIGLYLYKYRFQAPSSNIINTEQRLELACSFGANIMSTKFFFINIDTRLYINDSQRNMPMAIGYGINFNW